MKYYKIITMKKLSLKQVFDLYQKTTGLLPIYRGHHTSAFMKWCFDQKINYHHGLTEFFYYAESNPLSEKSQIARFQSLF